MISPLVVPYVGMQFMSYFFLINPFGDLFIKFIYPVKESASVSFISPFGNFIDFLL